MSFILLLAALTVAQSPLESKVRTLIAESGAQVAVAYRTLDGKSELLIDPDRTFHAASTMKVPVMIELYHQAEAGTLRLDDPLPTATTFAASSMGVPIDCARVMIRTWRFTQASARP